MRPVNIRKTGHTDGWTSRWMSSLIYKIPTGWGNFRGMFHPLKNIVSLCCGVCSKTIVHLSMAACSKMDHSLPITAQNVMWPFVKILWPVLTTYC